VNYALPICLAFSAATAALAPLAGPVEARLALIPDDILITFDEDRIESKWITVNDNVMGGRSKGGFSVADGRLIFKGSTNTNGGGFSSIRTRSTDLNLDGTDGLLFRVKGDGRTYISGLRNGTKFGSYDISYWARFETTGDWQTVRIPYEAYTPTFFGEDITGRAPALEADEITGAEFYIYDKKDGPFRLEVEWIGSYAESEDDETSSFASQSPGEQADHSVSERPVATTNAGGVPDADKTHTPDAKTRAWATTVLAIAIERGVPQFNHGNEQACADIYEVAIASLVMSPTNLSRDTVALLESGLRAGRDARSQTDRAWAYRYAMDAALASLGEPADRMADPARSVRAD
jgi:NADH dehydrogenase [ubiquinone] 1 alpha subcomplex assembly factor 1